LEKGKRFEFYKKSWGNGLVKENEGRSKDLKRSERIGSGV